MKSNTRRQLIIGASAAVLGLPPRLASASSEIVIGQVFPVTGPYARSAPHYRLGSEVFMNQLNSNGGLAGRRVRLSLQDDGSVPERTIELTRDLIRREAPLAMVGAMGTPNMLALIRSKVLSEAKVPMVGPITGAAEVRELGDPQVFHVRASIADEVKAIVEHIYTLGARRIAVLYQDDAMGKSGLGAAEEVLAGRSLKVTVSASYDRAKPAEVDAAVASISAARPEAVVLAAATAAVGNFVGKFRATGSGAHLYTISTVVVPEVVRIAGEAARGVGMGQVLPFALAGTTPIVREYQQALSLFAPGAEPNAASLETYIGAKVLVEGLRRAGVGASPERVTAALEGLSDFDVGGYKLRFGPGRREGSTLVDIAVIGANGRLRR